MYKSNLISLIDKKLEKNNIIYNFLLFFILLFILFFFLTVLLKYVINTQFIYQFSPFIYNLIDDIIEGPAVLFLKILEEEFLFIIHYKPGSFIHLIIIVSLNTIYYAMGMAIFFKLHSYFMKKKKNNSS